MLRFLVGGGGLDGGVIVAHYGLATAAGLNLYSLTSGIVDWGTGLSLIALLLLGLSTGLHLVALHSNALPAGTLSVMR